MAHTSLLLTHSSSSSPADGGSGGGGGGGGGCTYFGGTENRKQKTESNTTAYRLVKTNCKTEGGSTHSLKNLTLLLRVLYLHCRWQPVDV
jgi:hypothetical protein